MVAGQPSAGSVGAGLAAFASEWGAPEGFAAWSALVAGALVLGVAAFAPSARIASFLFLLRRRAFLTACAFAAAALSLGYVAFFLRGGPRIIDATSYFLQGRALSEGHLAWSIPEPSASFRGRFLLLREGAPDRIAGIFPPGYPLLLALGFLLGAPMVVGPLLAAALVVATYHLARAVGRDAMRDAEHREGVARLATLVSVACAALRYHTADTMAHGASALAITLSILAALRAVSPRTPSSSVTPSFLLAGLGVGAVASMRFASALPIGLVVGALGLTGPRRARAVSAIAVGVLPGLALLLLAQRAATGDALASTQRAYYAVADGPSGCFRYGLGAGVGCLHEHGDFVRARLSQGFGALAMLGTTLRRLRMHVMDIANVELLAPLVVLPLLAATSRATRAVRALAALVVGQILAYAPFYFDGNYPGGGARFFADVLPVEHVLLAFGVTLIAPRVAYPRKAAVTLSVALIGFAIHAARGHAALRDRDGGRPMFEPDVLARAGVTRGLVFVDTDHAFNLGHDPAALDGEAGIAPSHGLVVARLRDDDHDRLLAARLGRAGAYVYRFDAARVRPKLAPPVTVADLTRVPALDALAAIEPYSPAGGPGEPPWRFEAENDWPPLTQRGGWAEPVWMGGTCASGARALVLHRDSDQERGGPSRTASMRIALPVPKRGAWAVAPRVIHDASAAPAGAVVLASGARGELARWSFRSTPGESARAITCEDFAPTVVTLDPDDAPSLELTLAPGGSDSSEVGLDRVLLTEAHDAHDEIK